MFSPNRIGPLAGLTALFLAALPGSAVAQTAGSATNPLVMYGTETIEGLDIFYREAGRPGAPQIVLLHGFPTNSHMFRNVIPMLAEDFHVIAPDYPGYGLSSMPGVDEFEYSFANLASIVDELLVRRGFDRYALYLMDYGAPVGYRIAESHPERVTALIVQNGNAYDEGLREFWDPIKQYWKSGSKSDGDALRGLLTLDATKWQYQHGTRNPESISPDNWLVVQPLLDRPGTRKFSWHCSTTIARTCRCIHAGSGTSVPICHPRSSFGERTTRSSRLTEPTPTCEICRTLSSTC